ncbi:ABC transporter permease [Oleiharenicola lentus]|uniref:ABC transporter permease n=1 Tax=Oleiharenicola lentus TaxID=2508720 RepID=UPI003F66EBFA
MTPAALSLRLALSSLKDAWQRNLFALSGLVVGVGAVVTMLALALIVRHEALRQFDRTGLDVLAVKKVSGAGAQVTRRPPVIDLDLAAGLITAVPAFEKIAPIATKKTVLAFEGRQMNAEALGVTEAFVDLNGLKVSEGRNLTDLDRNQPFAVVGREQAIALRGGGTAPLVGKQIIIENKVLTIVGVLAPARTIKLHEGDINKATIMHAATFLRTIEGADITVVYAQHRAGTSPAKMADAAVEYFQQRVEGLAVQVTSAAAIVKEMERQLRLFTLFFGATGSIALVLGGAGIMNSLLLAVAERRREIGLRRALGAMHGDIQSQFLAEAVILCGTGGLLGIGLGSLVTWIISLNAGWVFILPPTTLVLGFGVALAVGVVAGFFPAYQAARLNPVVAMKADR